MSEKVFRAIAYGAVALLAVGAILFTKPLPSAPAPVAEVLSETRAEDLWRDRYDTLHSGETLVGVLARGGLSELLAREAIKTAKTIDPRRIPSGLQIRTRTAQDDTIPAEIILQLAIDRILTIRRTDSTWSAEEKRLPWTVDTVIVSGAIRSSLYDAMDVAARDLFGREHRERLTWSLADIYEYRVDMSRDLRVGDAFRVIAERKIAPSPNGMTTLTKFERILGASFTLSGVTTEAVRFHSDRVGGDFFDGNGKSMRAGFLRNPVAFRRISSGFGMRRHPILGIMRKHEGMDYAASAGTPIRAVGDGVVIRANYNNGYGNVVEIRHPNGYVTRYGHMKGFAPGITRGARVTIEQTIGYVGSTGLSTAPHLHFEVLVNGEQRNPRTALANHDSSPVPSTERVAFAEARSRVLALLDGPSLASVEQAGAARGTQQ
jgi:murein DD-endopeptidase MepM/ murein hydrolase activator NlpD